MIKLDRICIWIIIICFALIVPYVQYIRFLDELCAIVLVGIAGMDCIINRNWRRYKLLWVSLAIFIAYSIYTLSFFKFNTVKYVLTDFIIEMKPFLSISVMLAIAPKFQAKEKTIVRYIAIINALVVSALFLCGEKVAIIILYHVAYGGIIILMSAMFYLYCSIKDDGTVRQQDLIIVVMMLIAGLACTRSKYYGEFVVSIFFLFFYKYGITKEFKIKYVAMILAVALLVVIVSWTKIKYYFITGNSDTYDPNVMESYARPVMYLTSFIILFDYFPFGSGLASFASYASAENYSTLYYDYGLNIIWGLSPEKPDFICDAFYPTLAQFGVVGTILFIYFWVYIYSFLKALIRYNHVLFKYEFCIGCIIISAMLIESVGSTFFVQAHGMMLILLLGIICGTGKEIKSKLIEENITDNGKI